MIKRETRLVVADNSGGKSVLCIGIPGGTGKKTATVGDRIIVSVKDATPKGNVKKGGGYGSYCKSLQGNAA